METYYYDCVDGVEHWGYRIYTDDTKTTLSYEAAGFESEFAANQDMQQTLKDFGWE